MNKNILFLSLLGLCLTSCNKKEEFFAKAQLASVEIPRCEDARDLAGCEELSHCQAVFEIGESEDGDEIKEDQYSHCIEKLDPPVIQPEVDLEIEPVEGCEGGKAKGQGQKKVLVCHQSCNGEFHTITIACPALKAHLRNHGDYVGSCLAN